MYAESFLAKTVPALPADLPPQLAVVDLVGGATGERLRARQDAENTRVRKNAEILRGWGGVTGSARVTNGAIRPIWTARDESHYQDPRVLEVPRWLENS